MVREAGHQGAGQCAAWPWGLMHPLWVPVSYSQDGPSGPVEPSGSCPGCPVTWGLLSPYPLSNRDPAGLFKVDAGGKLVANSASIQASSEEEEAVESRDQGWGPWSQTVWAQTPALPLTRGDPEQVPLTQFVASVKEGKKRSYPSTRSTSTHQCVHQGTCSKVHGGTLWKSRKLETA